MTKQSSIPKIATKKHIARLERERRQVALVKTISIIAIAFVIILVGYGILETTYLKLRQSVADVNGEPIRMGYWQERVQWQRLQLIQTLQLYQYYQQFGMDTSQQQQQIQGQLQSSEYMGEQVLNLLINEALIRQEAKKRGITVTDAEVEEKIQSGSEFGFFPDGTPTPTITPTEFTYPTLTTKQLLLYPATSTPTAFLSPTPGPTNTPDLAATRTSTATSAPPASPTPIPPLATATATPYTLEGYKDRYGRLLDNIKSLGVKEATYRSVYENIIYREKLLDEITKDTPHTQEQVLARHILVPDLALAKAIQGQIQRGSDFAELAKKYSQDTGSAVKGGELDWSTHDSFVTEFADAAFSQEIGVIGEPVKTQYGYHIIQVVAREQLPVSADQFEKNRQTVFDDWLTKANDDAKAANKIIIYADIWSKNIPELPAAFAQQ
jgi:peptidyl-prolyl cis-trans isomerase D